MQITYIALRRILAAYEIEEDRKRRKGRTRLFIDCNKQGCPVTWLGDNRIVGPGLVDAIRRCFGLVPPKVTDEEFFNS